MEIDLAQLDSSADGSDLLRAEICIVGGGIAGLILAQELLRLGHHILLLEAGSSGEREYSQANEVIQAGHPHPGTMEPRFIALGGTSLVWGGQLLPLPQDAPWPVTAEDLSRYTSQAEQLLGVDELPYDAQSFFGKLNRSLPGLPGDLSGLDLQLSKFAPFSHRNLAHSIGRKLRDSNGARTVVHARAVELLLSPARDRIEAVLVRSPSGRLYRAEAKRIVLAAGAIETVRLLLASRSVAAQGVGNAHDQVGRNFHDHLTVTAATLRGVARKKFLGLRPWVQRGTLHAFKLFAGAELRREQNLNPVLAHITLEEPIDGGIATIRNLLRSRQQGAASGSMRSALPELPRALREGIPLVLSAAVQHRRYVSPRATVQLRLNVAQRCPSASRITLAPDSWPVLDWKIDESELATLRKFASYFRERLPIDGMDWEASLFSTGSSAIPNIDDARHAMGGACMGMESHSSVVNSQLRVHGLSNLFIASTAVFPDGSPQLPTLPLMALTLRLAGHLHRHA